MCSVGVGGWGVPSRAEEALGLRADGVCPRLADVAGVGGVGARVPGGAGRAEEGRAQRVRPWRADDVEVGGGVGAPEAREARGARGCVAARERA